MDYETARTLVLGAIAVASVFAAYKSSGDAALGFWLLAVGCAIGAA